MAAENFPIDHAQLWTNRGRAPGLSPQRVHQDLGPAAIEKSVQDLQ